MMAAVFLMQPLGQLLASVVGLAVLLTVGRNLNTETDLEASRVVVDRIWRYVVGVGAIPALVAIGFRLTIPRIPSLHPGCRSRWSSCIKGHPKVLQHPASVYDCKHKWTC